MLTQQQQRILSAPMPPPAHVAVVQPQAMIRAGQPSSIHPALDPQQQATPPQHHPKPQTVPANFFPDKGRVIDCGSSGLLYNMLFPTRIHMTI